MYLLVCLLVCLVLLVSQLVSRSSVSRLCIPFFTPPSVLFTHPSLQNVSRCLTSVLLSFHTFIYASFPPNLHLSAHLCMAGVSFHPFISQLSPSHYPKCLILRCFMSNASIHPSMYLFFHSCCQACIYSIYLCIYLSICYWFIHSMIKKSPPLFIFP